MFLRSKTYTGMNGDQGTTRNNAFPNILKKKSPFIKNNFSFLFPTIPFFKRNEEQGYSLSNMG